jgi:glycogen debranching enzyme
MKRIAADLLTPYGLRTLSPSHPAYVGRLLGDQPSRDRAYHQGTVWPWLLGPYVDALRRIGAGDKGVVELLAPFYAHLREAGVGCLSEVFDGDAPHTSRGAIHQAWTVAELLRIIKSLEAA